MTRQFLLVILFFVTSIAQTSIMDSLVLPLNLFPLHLLVGILVLHRAGPELGASWFVASAFILPLFGFDAFPWYAYFAVAIAGVLFTTRIFTNRSVYALVGMSLSLYLIARVGQFIAQPSSVTFQTTITAMLLIIIGSYIGFLTAKIFEKALHSFFLVPHKHVS